MVQCLGGTGVAARLYAKRHSFRQTLGAQTLAYILFLRGRRVYCQVACVITALTQDFFGCMLDSALGQPVRSFFTVLAILTDGCSLLPGNGWLIRHCTDETDYKTATFIAEMLLWKINGKPGRIIFICSHC